jgi:hypothetical protein
MCGSCWTRDDEVVASLPPACERISRGRQAKQNAPHVESKVGKTRQARAPSAKVPQFEVPALRLPANTLRSATAKPTFHAAGQRKVSQVDRRHQLQVEDTRVEPSRQDELRGLKSAAACHEFFPFADPGEVLGKPMLAVPDRGWKDRRLQAGQRSLEQVTFAIAARASDSG